MRTIILLALALTGCTSAPLRQSLLTSPPNASYGTHVPIIVTPPKPPELTPQKPPLQIQIPAQRPGQAPVLVAGNAE
jgi:hypothetical protein